MLSFILFFKKMNLSHVIKSCINDDYSNCGFITYNFEVSFI